MENNTQKTLVGFVLGVTVGVVAGILLAPASGKETMKNISDKASELKDQLGNQLTTAVDKLSTYADSIIGKSNNGSSTKNGGSQPNIG